jgi:voltage-gated potassium channel
LPIEDIRKKIIQISSLVAFIIGFGTVGYMEIEGWGFWDSLYMTTITLTTVGYREIHPLSFQGILFTMILMVGGVGTVLYALTVGARVILEAEIRKIFGRRRLEKMIKQLKDHYVVCGYGRMGKIIVKEMQQEGVEFVVIEKTPRPLNEKETIPMIIGDATQDPILKEAGIERARGLITVLSTDAENLFVVLSAHVLNPQMLIVARASEENSEEKLLRAGANRVVSPYHIGGLRMAHTILRPTVVDFVEFATRSGNIELQMREILVQEKSDFIGQTLAECAIGRDLGVIIVAIKQSTGETKFNPTFRTTIGVGDQLIALGEKSKLEVIEEIAKGKLRLISNGRQIPF